MPWNDLIGAQGCAAPAATPASALELLPGMRFVADRKTKWYYPSTCTAAARVAEDGRFYYATGESVKADGYARAPDC